MCVYGTLIGKLQYMESSQSVQMGGTIWNGRWEELKAQSFMDLQSLHSAGLVHRDVKPLNIIYAERQRRFKLIDLGACADLRTGTNYVPDESILDPNYCPPEQVGNCCPQMYNQAESRTASDLCLSTVCSLWLGTSV